MIPITPSVAVRILLWTLLLIGGAAAGFALDRLWFGHWTAGYLFHSLSLPAGLALLFLVMIVSRNTGRTLARNGREGDLPRLETNRLVDIGPYACMRHPMHLGLLLFPPAFGLTLGSPAFILLIAPAAMILMLVLILTLEEREAMEKFGQSYRDYRRRVPAFNLRPGCLKRLFETSPVPKRR